MPRNNNPLNIRGVDTNRVQFSPDFMPKGVPTADLSQAQQLTEMGNQATMQGNASNLEAAQRAVQVTQASLQSIQSSAGQRSSTLGQVMEGVATGLNFLAERKAQREQQKAEELAAQMSQEQANNYTQAFESVNQQIESARSIIREQGYEVGVNTVRANLQRIVFGMNLSPEDRRDLQKFYNDQLRSISSDMDGELLQTARDTNNAKVEVLTAQTRATLAPRFNQLGINWERMTPEQRQTEIDTIFSGVFQSGAFQELDDTGRAELSAALWGMLEESTSKGSEANLLAVERRDNSIAFSNSLQAIQAAFDSGAISYEEYTASIAAERQYFQMDGSPVTLTDTLEMKTRRAEAVQNYTALVRNGIYAEAEPLANLEVGKMVTQIIGGQLPVATLDANDPNQARAIEAHELYQQYYIGKVLPINRRLTEANTEMARLNGRIALAQVYENADPARQAQMREQRSRAFQEYEQITVLEEQRNGLTTEMRNLQSERAQYQNYLAPYGLQDGADHFDQYYNAPAVVTNRQIADQHIATSGNQGGFGLGFSSPTGASAQPPVGLGTYARDDALNGAPVPFQGTDVNDLVVTSWQGADRGDHKHGGIDIATSGRGLDVVSLRSGTVVAAGRASGFGQWVVVQDSQGDYAVYGHVDDIGVSVGDQVSQGQRLARIGTHAQSGERTTGAHLHLEIRRGGYGAGAEKLDVINYMKGTQQEQAPDHGEVGLGLPPDQAPTGYASGPQLQFILATNTNEIPAGAYLIPGTGRYVANGAVYFEDPGQYAAAVQRRAESGSVATSYSAGNLPQLPVEAVYNNSTPYDGVLASGSRSDYGATLNNSPSNNYGYDVLAEDNSFRVELHNVATRLNIPAQWLADVMAFETGGTFSPSIRNGLGATGLIQFMPETATGMGYSTAQLAGMSRTQQLKVVEEYLRGYDYNNIHELWMSVWGGHRRAFQDPSTWMFISDGGIKAYQYLQRLGEHVGRRYLTPADRLVPDGTVHTGFTQGCPTCRAMQQNLGRIIAHEAPR